jgi:hypothetical protein
LGACAPLRCFAELSAGLENVGEPIGNATVGVSEEMRVDRKRDPRIGVTEAMLHLGKLARRPQSRPKRSCG